MKTQWGNIGKIVADKEDKIVRVDQTESEDSYSPIQSVLWLNKLLPALSILQLSDVWPKKTFKWNGGKALVVSENEQYMTFGDAWGSWNVTPIVLEYSASLTVDLWYNLNYILVLTWDCDLTLDNIIPWCVYQFLIIQDNVWGHALNIMHPCYYIDGYQQNTSALSHSKLIVDYMGANYYASISHFAQRFVTVTFENYDWTVLQTWTCALWDTPEYTWPTPTKWWYIFEWWTPDLWPITWPTTYTATYQQWGLPWIFWNQTAWLITMTSDWTNWITMKDENVWANNDWEWTWDAGTWYLWTDVIWIVAPTWYHVAKSSDFNTVYNMWRAVWAWTQTWWWNFGNYLKTYFPWIPELWGAGELLWAYYCIDDDTNDIYALVYDAPNAMNIQVSNSYWTSRHMKVRLFKDTPVVADNTWTRIY